VLPSGFDDGDGTLNQQMPMKAATAALLRALLARDDLSAEEQRVVEGLPEKTKNFRRGAQIASAGSEPGVSIIIVDGIVGREVNSPSGKRKLTGLHIAGDFVDLHSYLLKVLDHGLIALAPCTLAYVPHRNLQAAFESSQHLTRMFWLTTVIDGAVQRAAASRYGIEDAPARICHLFCDLMIRSEIAGVANGKSFPLPITQQVLGELVGISTVHANRSLQALRAAGLVEWRSGTVIVPDFTKLASRANFDPGYLSLVKRPR